MATKDRLSNLDQLHFYTDGSLKKHHYRTIQDGNAILNNRWDSGTYEVIQGAAFIETTT